MLRQPNLTTFLPGLALLAPPSTIRPALRSLPHLTQLAGFGAARPTWHSLLGLARLAINDDGPSICQTKRRLQQPH